MYLLAISETEYAELGWFVHRGYFPEETWDAMEPAEDGSGYQIPEHAAWPLLEDDEALFTCMGGHLLTAVLDLRNQIV